MGPALELTADATTRWTLDRMELVDGALATERVGVAYAFAEWFDPSGAPDDGGAADGGEGGGAGVFRAPGGATRARVAPLTAAGMAESVAAQAAEVRRLKEDEGLANADPAVKAAVAELLRLKALLPAEAV